MTDIFLYPVTDGVITLTDPTQTTASQDAEASGVTLTYTTSLIDGVATGDATAQGALSSGTSTLIAGTATGEATAQGSTLTATTSLVSGVASVSPTALGALFAQTVSLISGSATGGAVAQGVNAAGATALLAGVATGDAIAAGTLSSGVSSLTAGAGTGGAIAEGTLSPGTSAILTGEATGGAVAEGLSPSTHGMQFFSSGVATGENTQAPEEPTRIDTGTVGGSYTRPRGPINAQARGVLLAAHVKIIAGFARGELVARLETPHIPPEIVPLVPGPIIIGPIIAGESPAIAATVRGQTITATVTMLAGRAAGEAIAKGELIVDDRPPNGDDEFMMLFAA